jgi:hypothetical protein
LASSYRQASTLHQIYNPLLKDPYALGKFCFGPPRGQETTFVRVDKWLPSLLHAPAPDKAEEQLLQHYLRSFSPATISDFAHWSGLTESYAQTILSRIKNKVSEVSVGSEKMLMLESGLGDHRDPPSPLQSAFCLVSTPNYLVIWL